MPPKPSDIQEIEDRDCICIISSGFQGHGKTHATKQLILQYLERHQNRMVIVFDPKNEDIWHSYNTLYFNVWEVMGRQKLIEKLKPGQIPPPPTKSEITLMKMVDLTGKPAHSRIRRIVPLCPDGTLMNSQQKRATLLCIANNFRRGLVFAEDVNDYIKNFESEEVEKVFKTIRHTSSDWIIHMQSLSPMRPIHYEAVTMIRMHFSTTTADKIAEKLDDMYEIVKIGQLIIQEVYRYHKRFHKKDPKHYLYKSYHVYIHRLDNKITNCTQNQFVKACYQYLSSNKFVIRDLEYKIANENNREHPIPSDTENARHQWIQDRIKMGMWALK